MLAGVGDDEESVWQRLVVVGDGDKTWPKFTGCAGIWKVAGQEPLKGLRQKERTARRRWQGKHVDCGGGMPTSEGYVWDVVREEKWVGSCGDFWG